MTLKVFDQVKVQITTEKSGPQHERVIMKLVEPAIEGLSIVSSMESWNALPEKEIKILKNYSEKNVDFGRAQSR